MVTYFYLTKEKPALPVKKDLLQKMKELVNHERYFEIGKAFQIYDVR